MPTFKVDLFQQARIHTETFEVEADSEADARKQADKIFKTKDYPTVDDVEVTDITPEPEEEAEETTEKETE